MDFPHDQFGLPLSDGYATGLDLDLQSTEMSSLWRRQRRNYAHAASSVKVSFRLSLRTSEKLIAWLQDNDDWFNMYLISGDSASEVDEVYPVNVRRTSTVVSTRQPYKDATIVSFEVETHSMPDYIALLAAASGQPAATYPAGLPLPKADGFVSSHADRNITTYTLLYAMDTDTLKQWQAFAAFQGTAWFKHYMVSSNTYGAEEVIRYVSSPSLTLAGPNSWLVSISAEGYPNRGNLPEFASAPIEEGSYDYPIEYNDATHDYDGADSGVIPPQGSFTMPAGTVIVAQAATGTAPQTGTAAIRINRNGSIVCSPASSPVWSSWHTDADTLVAPALTVNATIEVSTDGSAWSVNVPGTRYDLKNQDIYLRLVHTDSVSSSRAVSVPLQFDDGTITYAVASATVQLSVALTVTSAGSGVVNGFVWNDNDTQEARLVAVGVSVQPDGRCLAATDGQTTGAWFNPITANAGIGKWLEVLQTAGTHSVGNLGIRQELSSPRSFSIVVRNQNYEPSVTGDFVGQCNIYSAQTGGVLLGTGTLNLTATATSTGIPP